MGRGCALPIPLPKTISPLSCRSGRGGLGERALYPAYLRTSGTLSRLYASSLPLAV